MSSKDRKQRKKKNPSAILGRAVQKKYKGHAIHVSIHSEKWFKSPGSKMQIPANTLPGQ